jgi:hypothetical protein
LFDSQSIIMVIKSRMMSWAGKVARMWEMWNADETLIGKHEGMRPLGRSRRGWENIREVGVWVASSGSGYGTVVGSCTEPSGSMKGEEFDYLSDCISFSKSAPWS